MSATLFIDANQYLELYCTIEGKKLLDSLDEQKPYIFVSAQIVDEVLRNKLQVAKSFFTDKLKEINTVNAPVPDHLIGSAIRRRPISGKLLTKRMSKRGRQ